MNPIWDCNAPQFYDFVNPHDDDDQAEKYFEITNETDGIKSVMETSGNISKMLNGLCIKELSSSPRKPLQTLSNIKDVNLTAILSFPKPEAETSLEKFKSDDINPQRMRRRSKQLRDIRNEEKMLMASPILKKQKRAAPPIIISSPSPVKPKSLEKTCAPETPGIAECVVSHEDALPGKEETAVPTVAVKQYGLSGLGAISKPRPFIFATDARIKSLIKPIEEKKRDFVSSLRHYSPNKNLRKGCTIPSGEPAVARKRKRSNSQNKFVSLAEQIKAFETKTPERFRMKSRSGDVSSKTAGNAIKPTKPATPNFHYKPRPRVASTLSREEKEELEAEEMKKYQFKAQPVNKKIFRTPTGMSVKPIKPPTVPVPFALHFHEKTVTMEPPSQVFRFRAQPVPTNILKHRVGLGEKKQIPSTKPKTPPFLLKEREQAWEKSRQLQQQKEQEKKEAEAAEAAAAKHSSLLSVGSSSSKIEKKPVVPQPFSFDQKDAERWRKKEEKIKELIEKENIKVEFRAQPLPPESPSTLPEIKPKSSTVPEPFALNIDHRGQLKAEKWKQEVEEEIRKQKEAMIFKANPCKVTQKNPFKPQPPSRLLTVPDDVELNTEKRSHERQEFELKLQQLEAEREKIMKRREAEEADRLKEEIALLRKQAVHKALPVPHYKPLVIKPSDMPLTVPKSPKLLTAKPRE